jgi:dolichyl-phosphate beta-glucosyltransferase
MKISVCIPMYNESSVIAETARTLAAYMARTFEEYEILFCDDGSTDRSAETVRELELPCVHVIGYEKNRGKGCAVRTAMLAATGDIVMFTDADLAYGTDVIARVAETFAAHPESALVIGSRNLDGKGYEGYTVARRIASKAYIKVLSVIGGFKLSDSQCGCKAFTGDAAKKIFPRCEVDRFAFDFECILWATKLGMKIVEMPVKIINHRESKVSVVKDALRMLKDIIKMKKRIKKAKV